MLSTSRGWPAPRAGRLGEDGSCWTPPYMLLSMTRFGTSPNATRLGQSERSWSTSARRTRSALLLPRIVRGQWRATSGALAEAGPEAVAGAVQSVLTMSFGDLVSGAVHAAEYLAGPWTPMAPGNLAHAYRLAALDVVPTIGAILPWNHRRPAGTCNWYSNSSGRPVSRTRRTARVMRRPAPSPSTSRTARPRSSLGGAKSRASLWPTRPCRCRWCQVRRRDRPAKKEGPSGGRCSPGAPLSSPGPAGPDRDDHARGLNAVQLVRT
jgi:hypothetical protein